MDFIRAIVAEDQRTGRYGGHVVTRFPPEPNGYLHIGHAKSICLNFGIALENGGRCHLRFDDTNPTTEDMKYVEAAQRDIRWLGFDWGEHLYFASDYFDIFYECAVQLIKDGKAYVDSLSEEEIRDYRGTVTEPGRESPYRNRPTEESLELFECMRDGEFPDGAHVLRAKIDMSAANMKMRDPLLYRIRHAHHYRTGDKWCIYPMYDFAHPLSDAIEGITHSICTLEFENNREIYDWVIDNCKLPPKPYPRPYQYEFARLNLDYTVMSKRKLLELVNGGHVSGWDDPRLLTIAGLRRRGVTPEAIRDFAERVGVARTNSRIEMSLLESCIRDDLNTRAPRVMAVLRPLKVVITNYPEDQIEEFDAPYWPHDVPKEGSRPVPFGRELYIERDDFMEEPPRGFFRLAPGREVRLRYAYVIRCDEVVKDPQSGEILELRCSYDPASKGGATADGRKVKGTIHWVSAAHAISAEARLYDRLFTEPNPDDVEEGKDFKEYLNPNSLQILQGARVEPSLANAGPGARYQFERQGYFVVDTVDSRPGALVFNRIIELRDSWAKVAQGAQPAAKPGRTALPGDEAAPVDGGGSAGSRSETRDQARAANPALAAAYERFRSKLGLPDEDADVLTGDPAVAAFFTEALAAHDNPKLVANWVINEVLRELKERPIAALPFGGVQLGELVALIDNGVITATIAKEVFAEMIQSGSAPAAIVERRGLRQVADPDALTPVIDDVVAANLDKAEQYRAGKTGLWGFFVGQVMQATGGKANPQLVRELLQRKLAAVDS
ncbi:MAG: glutamine--tRNA ligase [Chloroflexi bacterium]|nr:MAG: glutamine--tRNA ligase [Chloroflexota bacterium]